MGMHENVALDPGIGVVEVEHVIDRASEDIIVELDDGLTEIAIATGKIHDVVTAGGRTEETIADNAASTAFDPAAAVKGFKRGGSGRECATAHEKRTTVEREILVCSRAKRCVIEKECATGNFDASGAVAIEKCVSNACLWRADAAIDSHAAPTDS